MADNEYAGSAMYLAWQYLVGTVVTTEVLNTEFRNFSWQPTLNFIDATAGADTYERLLPSFGVGADIPLEMLAQTGGTALAVALARQTKGTLLYGPAGTANNEIAYKIPAYSQGPQWTQPFNDVVNMNCNFRQFAAESTGKWTSGAYAAF